MSQNLEPRAPEPRHSNRWIGYVAVIAVEAAITAILLLIDRYVPLGRFPIMYFIATGIIAYFYGVGPSILAFILGAIAFDYSFTAPTGTLWPLANTPASWAAWIAFLLGTSLVAVAMTLIRRYQHRSRLALIQAEHELAVRRQAEEALEEEQQHRLEFYRRTIQAATDGKLMICDRQDIKRFAGQEIESWTIGRPEDLANIRHGVEAAATSAGMSEDRAARFTVCIGEAATNALKHAGTGAVSLHRIDNALICVVGDTGSGIQTMSIPDVALTRGYSTAGTLGMGYKIMISLADRVYLETGPEGVTVAIEMMLEPAGEQALLPAGELA
jgi:anti-sigma regulatory factor (Ser/Thr protein kinase)